MHVSLVMYVICAIYLTEAWQKEQCTSWREVKRRGSSSCRNFTDVKAALNFIQTELKVALTKMDQPYWGTQNNGGPMTNIGYVIGMRSSVSGGPNYRIDWDPEKKLHVNFYSGRKGGKYDILVDVDDGVVNDVDDDDKPRLPPKSERMKCEAWRSLTKDYLDVLPTEIGEQLVEWATDTETPPDLRYYARYRILVDFPQLPHPWGMNLTADPDEPKWKWKWCVCMPRYP
jgi:hypothetical protein